METKYENIVIAVDGSEASEKALQKAIQVAKRNDATLVIAHVIDSRAFARLAAYDSYITDKIDEDGKQLLADYERIAHEANHTKTKMVLEYGSPKTVIAKKIIPEAEADLIVMAATGLNAVERFMIGSVSERTVRDAKCDVLIVR